MRNAGFQIRAWRLANHWRSPSGSIRIAADCWRSRWLCWCSGSRAQARAPDGSRLPWDLLVADQSKTKQYECVDLLSSWSVHFPMTFHDNHTTAFRAWLPFWPDLRQKKKVVSWCRSGRRKKKTRGHIGDLQNHHLATKTCRP